MSTNSQVAVINDDQTVTSIYVHFDGYLSGVGNTLLTHYNTLQKAQALTELGNIRSLEDNINDIEPFEEPSITFNSIDTFLSEAYRREYNYLFSDKWYLVKGEQLIDLEKLCEEIRKQVA